MKVAKARKSTHKKGTGTKTIRGKVLRAANNDPDKEWEIEEMGPVYLLWGKKKVRTEKGKTIKKYYVRKNDKHLIWVKWATGFADLKNTQWSAEPQSILRESGLSKEVDAALKKKIIWPFPSVSDGKDSGHVERMAICKEAKYQLWMGKTKEEKGATWNLVNGVEATTASSDASTSEHSEGESSNVESNVEEEEEDEV